MKVLLTSDVEKIGSMGDVVEVKVGFARNFLFPRKIAVEVTPHNVAVTEKRKLKFQKKMALEKMSAMEQKQKLEVIKLTIRKKAGENDVLFGSVTPTEIEKELANAGIHIEKKKIHLEEPIKRLGNYSCKVKLFKDVEAEIAIEVLNEGDVAAE